MSLLYYFEALLRKSENILPIFFQKNRVLPVFLHYLLYQSLKDRLLILIFGDTDHSHLKKQMEGALQPLTPLYNILMCTQSA